MSEEEVADQKSRWTNERHFNFLNSVEADFVRTMLENNDHVGTRSRLLLSPRLDRLLPDTAESTLDLKIDKRRRHSTSSDILDSRRSGRRPGRLSLQSYPSSQDDQVVPQLEIRRGDMNEKDDRRAGPTS